MKTKNPPFGARFNGVDGVWFFTGDYWSMYPHDKILARHNGLQVNHDWQRGYAHLHPLPDSVVVEAYYNDDQFYTTHSPPDWLEKERQEYQAGLWDSYFKYLYEVAGIEGRRVLDYGCGGGWFLNWLYGNTSRNHFGVEPSKIARDIADMHTPHIYASADELRGVFDVISLQLVLEHVADPVDFLKSLSGLLAPDGKLLITVPNDFNPLQKKIGYWGFICPVHINYFTPDSLAHVLREAGFSVTHISTTFPMELFIILGIDYRDNDTLGRKCHNFRLRVEKVIGWCIFKFYEFLYRRWGWGREIICIAEKSKS